LGQSGRFRRWRDGVTRTRRAGRGAASRGGGAGMSGLTQSVTRAAPRRMVGRVARRFSRPAEDSLAVRVAVLLAVLIAVAAVGVQEEFKAQAALAAVAIVVAHGVSYLRRRSPNWWMKLAIVALIFGVARDFFMALVANPYDPRIPLVRLFLWLQVLHSFDLPARKDLKYSLASAVVLMAVGAVYARATAFGLLLVPFTVAAGVSLAAMQAGHGGPSWRGPGGLRGRPGGGPVYWRGLAFDTYTGRGWRMSDQSVEEFASDQSRIVPRLGPDEPWPAGSEQSIQTFYVEAEQPNVIFAAYRPFEVFFPTGAIGVDRYAGMRSPLRLEQGMIYSVISRVPAPAEALLARGQGDVPPPTRAGSPQFPAIPPGAPPRAREFPAGGETPSQRPGATRRHLRRMASACW